MQKLFFFVFTLVLYGVSQNINTFSAKNSDIELMPVTIHGAGVKAGTYYVAPALRVFDIIKLAAADGDPDLRLIDCRSVKITFGTDKQTIDLLKYLSTGDISHNPFVKSGMDIQLGYAINFVQIQGELQGILTGTLPISKKETYGDLLSLFTFRSIADSNNIILTRDNGETKHYTSNEIASLTVLDRDFVMVLPKKDLPKHANVNVCGEIATPGLYPIQYDKTIVSEIVKLAGGATVRGDLNRAYIIRRTKIQNQPAKAFLDGQNNVRPEVTGGFKYLAASRDYAVIPVSKEETVLEDGDEIVIPPIETCVYVSGSVKKPGAYNIESGKDIDYYITVAGGFTKTADKRNVKVITPYTNDAYQISVRHHLSSGDIIMVPEAQEDKWIKRWSPIITAAATMISSISIVVGLTQK